MFRIIFGADQVARVRIQRPVSFHVWRKLIVQVSIHIPVNQMRDIPLVLEANCLEIHLCITPLELVRVSLAQHEKSIVNLGYRD